jgi:hypothetical protein
MPEIASMVGDNCLGGGDIDVTRKFVHRILFFSGQWALKRLPFVILIFAHFGNL